MSDPKNQWLKEFFPEYTSKGKRLYHRRSTLTPKQALIKDFFERLREEEILQSETTQTISAMVDGFMTSFYEDNGKWRGLGYRKTFGGKEIEIVTPFAPTRKDAEAMLIQFIRAYNK